MTFKLFLLLFVSFFLHALLSCKFAEFKLVKRHVPIDCRIVFVLFLPGIVSDAKAIWVFCYVAFQALLLD